VDLSDAIYTLGFIFLGTAGPPAPGLECGYDFTADDLFCGEYLPCRQPVIPFEVIDGFAVVEGDIVLAPSVRSHSRISSDYRMAAAAAWGSQGSHPIVCGLMV
jgi:hypothetical protein